MERAIRTRASGALKMNFAACCKRIKLPIGHTAMRCQARAVFRFLIDFRVTNRQRQRQCQRGRERSEQCCWDMHGTCETCNHRNQNSSGIEKTQRERGAMEVTGGGRQGGNAAGICVEILLATLQTATATLVCARILQIYHKAAQLDGMDQRSGYNNNSNNNPANPSWV